ncbi:hypothetical protein BOTBODRAFT_143664, partial [Botryobasidium botryosum FD-172 SS1]
MEVRKTHLGRYLLCVTVVQPSRAAGIMICVNDPEGATFQLTIYNFPGTITASEIVLDTIFPVESILATREPTMVVRDGPRDIAIRINSPSDIAFFPSTDAILKDVTWKNRLWRGEPILSPEEWNTMGDFHLQSRHYFGAIIAYTRALESTPSGFNSHYWMMRAVAYYRFRYHTAAIADATFVLNMPDLPRELKGKAAHLIAQCECILGRYEAAISSFELSLSYDPDGAESMPAWIKACKPKFAESRGDYDWAAAFNSAKKLEAKRLDVADYMGPMKVVPMSHRGGGRGVVTTRSNRLNFITRELESPCASDAMSQLITKIAGHPELAPLIYGLYAGPTYPNPPSEYPPLPLADIKKRHPLVYEVDIDAEKLQNIYTYSAFVPRSIVDSADPDSNNPPSALYLLPSLFNHACAATANWYNFREVMVTRAIKDLEEGEELTIAYVQGHTAWERQAALRKHEFTCNCSLCVADRKDGEAACSRRSELAVMGDKHSPATETASIIAARKQVCEVEGTYASSRGPIRPAASRARQRLVHAYDALVTKASQAVFLAQSISMNIAALEGLGMIILDKSVTGPTCIDIAASYDFDSFTDADHPIDVKGSSLLSTEGNQYTRIMLLIATAFRGMLDVDRATRWSQAGLRVHDIFTGGELALQCKGVVGNPRLNLNNRTSMYAEHRTFNVERAQPALLLQSATQIFSNFRQVCNELLRKDAEDRRLGPGPSPSFNPNGHLLKRNALLTRQLFDKEQAEKKDLGVMRQFGYRQHHSTIPLRQLKRKDPEGATFQLAIFDFPGTALATGAVLDTIFPVGSIFAVREPTMTEGINPGLRDDFVIRIDSPSDMIFFLPSDAFLKDVKWKHKLCRNGPVACSPEKWSNTGDIHLRDRHYLAAAVAYARALLEPAPSGYDGTIDCIMKRAVAYGRLKYHTAALTDVTLVLSTPHVPRKMRRMVVLLAAQCEYHLGRYEAAISTFELSRSYDPDDTEATTADWLKRCRQRIKESRGVYDWVAMFDDALKDSGGLDVAEYVGPMKVVSMPHCGGGRGVVTTRAVKAGELILVAKPVVSSFPAEVRSQHYAHGLNHITREPESPCASDAMSQLVTKIAGHPEIAPLVYGLYAGPMYPNPPSEYPPTPPADIINRHPLVFPVDIDTEKLQNIYTYNAFVPRPIHIYTDVDPSNPPSALYLLPSLFNHACAATANWYHFGEVMVIRAVRDLEEGEELTIAYVEGHTAWERQAALKKHRFTCSCPLCDADRKDGEAACGRRSELMLKAGAQRSLAEGTLNLAGVRKYVCEVEGTYASARGPVRPASSRARQRLADAYLALTNKTSDHISLVQSIAMRMATLEGLGMIILDKSVVGPISTPECPEPLAGEGVPINIEGSSLLSTEGDRYIKIIHLIFEAFRVMQDDLRTARWSRANVLVSDLFVGRDTALYAARHKLL